MSNSILQIRDLRVTFNTQVGELKAVRGIDVDVAPGEILGVVGESGSGKSVSFLAAMGLLPSSATISGSVMLDGKELIGAKRKAIRSIRGKSLAMVFQDPLSALNPVHRVGDQIVEMIQAHQDMNTHDAEKRAVELLEIVGIPQPGERARQYPHEFSGGMRQRVVIAMAIANNPKVLIADEATTALDVTTQDRVLTLIDKLAAERGLSVLLITHDLGVAAQFSDDIMVMYAGKLVENGSVDQIFSNPAHPYTKALLDSRCDYTIDVNKPIRSIAGQPPRPDNRPNGCVFSPRCAHAEPRCSVSVPPLTSSQGRLTACFRADELFQVGAVN